MRALVFLTLVYAVVAGCTFPAPTPLVHQPFHSGREAGINYGDVLMVRSVPLAGETSAVGRMGGAYVGGAIGSAAGAGLGRVIASCVGGAAGVAAGEAAEERVRRKEGLEITVQLDTGLKVTVVQEGDVEFVEGERVRVLLSVNNPGRVLKY